jgi:hypothetical protein
MKKIKYKFALILYASGAGNLISLHHRAGFIKKNIKLIIQHSYHKKFYTTVGRVGAFPLFPSHANLCCKLLMRKLRPMERNYFKCLAQICSVTHIFSKNFRNLRPKYQLGGNTAIKTHNVIPSSAELLWFSLVRIFNLSKSINYTPISLLWKTGFHFS